MWPILSKSRLVRGVKEGISAYWGGGKEQHSCTDQSQHTTGQQHVAIFQCLESHSFRYTNDPHMHSFAYPISRNLWTTPFPAKEELVYVIINWDGRIIFNSSGAGLLNVWSYNWPGTQDRQIQGYRKEKLTESFPGCAEVVFVQHSPLSLKQAEFNELRNTIHGYMIFHCEQTNLEKVFKHLHFRYMFLTWSLNIYAYGYSKYAYFLF